MKKLFQKRLFKFIICGGIAAMLNLLIIFVMIELLEFNTPALRNIANVLSIEISLLFSFFIYKIWVWSGGIWTVKEVLLRQLLLYHVSAGTAVSLRIFLLFPILDLLNVNYTINTLFGIFFSAAINYLISDKLVFKTRSKNFNAQIQLETKVALDFCYSEELTPSLTDTLDLSKPNTHLVNFEKNFLFSIVIPAHNEEDSIDATIQSISQLLELKKINYEILVVNDSSRDGTETILQSLSIQNKKVRYINNYYPNGFGFAVRCGLENFRGDAVTIVMADCSDSPEDIVNYYHKLCQGYECVFGSRFIKGGKVIDYPMHKLIINRLANLFIQILFGIDFNDTTNAFKAYRREVIDGVLPLLSHHFNLTVEIPLKAIVRKYSYTIIPITWRNRTTGVSKLKLKEMGSRYLFIVLYIFFEKMLSRGDYIRNNLKPVMRR